MKVVKKLQINGGEWKSFEKINGKVSRIKGKLVKATKITNGSGEKQGQNEIQSSPVAP